MESVPSNGKKTHFEMNYNKAATECSKMCMQYI